MDVRRLSPSRRTLWILVLAGHWLPMVQLDSSRMISIHRRSNPDEREGGERTNLTVNSCNSSTCIYGGCSSNDTCTCNHGYRGPSCNEVRPCNSKTCIHGSCTSNDACICYYGFKGPSCDEVLSCSSKSCIYGVCSLNDTCTCNHGFKGPTCNEVAFCTSNTCIHGSCLSSGSCSCNNEFKGPSCNEAILYEEPIWIFCVLICIPFAVMLCIYWILNTEEGLRKSEMHWVELPRMFYVFLCAPEKGPDGHACCI